MWKSIRVKSTSDLEDCKHSFHIGQKHLDVSQEFFSKDKKKHIIPNYDSKTWWKQINGLLLLDLDDLQ